MQNKVGFVKQKLEYMFTELFRNFAISMLIQLSIQNHLIISNKIIVK